MNKAPLTRDAIASITVEEVAAIVGQPVEDVDAATANGSGRLTQGRLSCRGALAYVHRLTREGKLEGRHPYRNIRLTMPVFRIIDATGNGAARLRESLFFAADITIRTDILTYTRPRVTPAKTQQRICNNVPIAVWAAIEVIAKCCGTGTSDVACWAVLLHTANKERIKP